ncbi:pyroglutamyl-peptidase I [Alkalicoccus saliphilus]|uniref:Pyroglutamyl-peptidase I n=1 Tax=Alkalicoccus saliphilus TaxID=200989 RepID=A0A2T4U3C9_9BACI|nr:pyroglutamyl-peptidase I [Alkalicoccus saliphilus]PTL37879.1 peptidase C15 [Alkalicoccus saliphilus]
MKILLTGFEPFGDMAGNPSSELIKWAEKERFAGAEIRTESLPVVYKTCADKALQAVTEWEPDAVIHLGVAAGRSLINIERIAVNVEDASTLSDNSGDSPKDRPVEEGGPDGIFATLPVRDITDRLQEAEVPAGLSYSAGTYICNTTLYRTLRFIEKQELSVQAGFVHVPLTPELAAEKGLPSMDLSVQKKALTSIIQTVSKGGARYDQRKVKL